MASPILSRLSKLLVGIGIALFVVFMVAPLASVVGASLAAVPFWQFPPDDLTFQWYRGFLQDEAMVKSTLVSFGVAVLVSIVTVVVGLMTAAGIVTSRRGLESPLLLVALFPLLIPHLALGLAIYVMLIEAGVRINIFVLVLAQLMVTLPIVVGILGSGMASLDPSTARAAASLGARPSVTFVKVIVPVLWPAIAMSLVMAAVLSFEDSSIALFVNNQLTGLVPLPVRMLFLAEFNSGPIIAVGGSVLVGVALIVVVLLELTIGIGRVLGVGRQSGGRPLDGTLRERRRPARTLQKVGGGRST